MNPLVHEYYDRLKLVTEMITPALLLWEEVRADFDKKARIFADGTLDAVLPHFMSISDMKQSQSNLNRGLIISDLLGQIHDHLKAGYEQKSRELSHA